MKFFKYFSLFFFFVCGYLILKQEWKYDEAWSYFGNLGSTALQICKYTNFKFANNHLLNSLYAHLLQEAGIQNVACYRFLSFLSFIIYSIYYFKFIKYKTGRKFLTEGITIPGLIICFFPFILPFFTLFTQARGYSIAIAGIMAALYFFSKSYDSFSIRNFVLFLIAGAISSLSIFSFIYPFASMILFICVKNHKEIFSSFKSLKNVFLFLFIFIALLLLSYYIYDKGKIINSYDPTIAGGNSFLKNGMISSLFSYLALQGVVSNTFVFLMIRTVLLITLIPASFLFYRNSKIPVEHKLFLVTILLTVLSHFFFKSKYPFGRTLPYLLLFFYLPLITASLVNPVQRAIYYAHFLSLIAVGLLNISLLVKATFYKNTLDALTYIHTNFPGSPILFDIQDPNIDIYNLFNFQNKLAVKARKGPINAILDSAGGHSFILVSLIDSTAAYAAHNVVRTDYVYDGNLAVFVYKPVLNIPPSQ
jgi:hypothetical protein